MLDKPDDDALTPHRFTREEYERVVESGALDDTRVELLRGAIVEMTPRGELHENLLARLNHLLVIAVGERGEVRAQSALAATDDSMPEPDFAVVPAHRSLRDPHPRSAWLAIEVAVSSRKRDLGLKAAIYAQAGVEEYWVVDASRECIVVMQDPRDGVYATLSTHRAGDVVQLARLPGVAIDVAELFA